MEKKVLFSINTIFHLMIVKLFIKNNDLSDVLLIVHSRNANLLNIVKSDSDFESKLILDYSNVKNQLINMIENKRKIEKVKKFLSTKEVNKVFVFKDNDLINQTIIQQSFKAKIKISLIEEGLALYNISNSKQIMRNQNLIKRVLFHYPKYLMKYQGLHPNVDEIIANFPSLIPTEKIKNKKIIKMEYTNISKRQILDLYNYFNIDKTEYDHRKNDGKIKIMYIGQPLSELNVITKDIENEKLDLIFKHFIKNDKRLTVIIKPHPSEFISKYDSYLKAKNIELVKDTHIPAELIPINFNINFVITAYSSSSFYISKWFDIKSWSVFDLFFDNDNKINGNFLRRIFKEVYNIERLKSVDELSTLLENGKL
ncbi:polysialyltransferase family glycosyltransferase [Amphibacillus sediminis]|uniref:polysialyltransferase family glycosyltransferase n=1 Tax=Amphibacillus sediminis TaxID=360185 RepID=UPI0008326324|nr:polysialyltransferase family glycosyltransferase [Amphibacillus sediminis]